MSTVVDAIQQVLADAGEPLHYREITQRVLSQGLWSSEGKTPEATVNAQLAHSIKHEGDASPGPARITGQSGRSSAT